MQKQDRRRVCGSGLAIEDVDIAHADFLVEHLRGLLRREGPAGESGRSEERQSQHSQ